MKRGELDFFVLKLELRARDSGLELGGRLVPEGLVDDAGVVIVVLVLIRSGTFVLV